MDSMTVNPFDILVLIVLVLSGIYGLTRGFVREVLGILAWILAFVSALYGFSGLAPLFMDFFPTVPLMANWSAGVLIFLIILVALYLVSTIISRVVKNTVLSPLDRSLGFLFGLFRGWIIMIALILGLNWIVPPAQQPDWFHSAVSRPLLDESAGFTLQFLPESYRDVLAGGYRSLTPGEKAMEARRQFERLVDPRPVSPGAPAAENGGYGGDARRELDRLIEGTP